MIGQMNRPLTTVSKSTPATTVAASQTVIIVATSRVQSSSKMVLMLVGGSHVEIKKDATFARRERDSLELRIAAFEERRHAFLVFGRAVGLRLDEILVAIPDLPSIRGTRRIEAGETMMSRSRREREIERRNSFDGLSGEIPFCHYSRVASTFRSR